MNQLVTSSSRRKGKKEGQSEELGIYGKENRNENKNKK